MLAPMDPKIIAKIEREANTIHRMGFAFCAELLRTACEQNDMGAIQRVGLLLRRANRKPWADRLFAIAGVPGWDKVEV